MSNIPKFLIDLLDEQYNEELVGQILEGYNTKKVTTFRVNTLKTTLDEVESFLQDSNISYKKISWYDDAFILETNKEETLRNLFLYKEGKIYLQSLSSMLPPLIVDPKSKESILDMAAAPGGKTTQMAVISNNEALITAVEKNQIRADRLKYNLTLQGATKVNVLVEDARKLDEFLRFDKILLDAPCSGSGTLDANNPKISKVFTLGLVKNSKKLQIELLRKASSILKENGEIIYSTCSILKDENEQVLETILKEGNLEIVPIDLAKYKDVPMLPVSIPGTLCVCPTELYEGFFVSKLRKIKK